MASSFVRWLSGGKKYDLNYFMLLLLITFDGFDVSEIHSDDIKVYGMSTVAAEPANVCALLLIHKSHECRKSTQLRLVHGLRTAHDVDDLA